MKNRMLLMVLLLILVSLMVGGCKTNTSDIQGIEWQWVSLIETQPASQSLNPDAENYTITFVDDVNVAIKADCNQVLGTYSVSGSKMTIETGISTMAFCGEESQDVFYLGLLAQVASFELVDNRLQLGLTDDAGTIGFQMSGQAVVPTAEPPPTEEPAPTAELAPDDGNPAVFLAIITPRTNSEWESTELLEITGSARAMPNDDVIVFFVDGGRNIYGYACAELGAPNDANIKTYKTHMTAPVNTSTEGKVIAVVLGDDGSVVGSAGVFVAANPDKNDRHVTIEEPGYGCIITNPGSFTIEGSAEGGFENNIVVQAQDVNGNVLAEATTNYSSGSTGGPGSWSVTLSVNVARGTEGRLVTFSPDPAGGSPISSRIYTVFYGEE